jgi:carbon monoxide dehydrogenase subunit G
MKVNGDAVLNAPTDKVWAALNDPAVLVRTIPGCQRLETVGPDTYRMTISAGIASIKGTYLGDVSLAEQNPPGSFVLRASGAGGPGTVSADVKVDLEDLGDGRTKLRYDADAVVGGTIGGVGQRVLTGVARKTAGEFFTAVDDVLTGKALVGAPLGAPVAPAPEAFPAAAPAAGAVYEAPAAPPRAGVGLAGGDFVKGLVVGAAVALVGVLVGGILGRRR